MTSMSAQAVPSHRPALRRRPPAPSSRPALGCPARSARSLPPPRWRWTPRPRRSRRQGRPVIGFGAGEPDFPTPGHIVEAAVGRLPRPGQPPLHARPAACPSCGRPSPPRRSGTAASTWRPAQVLVTNGGKQAVANTFAALLDPGDEVLRPRPLLDDLPRGDRPGRRRHRRAADRRVERLPGLRRAAGGGGHRPHQGAAVRVALQPHRRGVPARAGGRDRPLGRWAGAVGGHRRDLRAPRLRRRTATRRCRSWSPSWRTAGSC